METRKKISVFLLVLLAVAIIITILYFSHVLTPSAIQSGTFSTIAVDRGPVTSSIKATGVVEPENEVLVLSPATSIIRTIYTEPGSRVEAGQTLLRLDTNPVTDEIDRLTDQLEVKRNNLEKTQLNAQSTKLDLDYNEEVKKLKITSLRSQLADQEQLLEVGGISPAKLEQTKQEITLAEKDLQMMVEKNSIRLKQLEAEEKGLLMQIRMDEKTLEEQQELLSKMDVKAPSSGIILSVSAHVGEKVNADRMLIRMSDLSSFKIIGSAEEQYANRIKTGKQVFVNFENELLEGQIGNVTPELENSKVQFNVHLARSNHTKLIANQQVQVQIINESKEDVLRIKRLPEIENPGKFRIFRVENNIAVRTEITVGLVGSDYCEVLEGLHEGDRIIEGDLGAFRHADEIEIKN